MNLDYSYSSEERSLEKFYARIRLYLDDIKQVPEGTKKPLSDKLKDLNDEQKYGLIKRTELEMLLLNYDETSERSTKCERLLEGSFAKLLYSKPGFHHPSSTDYLVEDLNIKECERDSFLGGHSTFSTPEENSLAGITEHHLKMYIKNRAKELLDLMDDESALPGTLDDDVGELSNKDPQNGNTFAVRGKHHFIRKRYQQAVDDLKRALESNCDYMEKVRLTLSEACYKVGMNLYSRNKFDQANFSFQESLIFNPQHDGSRLHTEMCIREIQKSNRRFGEQANTFMARRR